MGAHILGCCWETNGAQQLCRDGVVEAATRFAPVGWNGRVQDRSLGLRLAFWSMRDWREEVLRNTFLQSGGIVAPCTLQTRLDLSLPCHQHMRRRQSEYKYLHAHCLAKFAVPSQFDHILCELWYRCLEDLPALKHTKFTGQGLEVMSARE